MTQTKSDLGFAPDDAVLRAALAQHYVAHGLPPDGGANDRWFRVRLGPVSLRLPNPPARRRALLFHDVNHIATGYNTTFSQGEVTIAAFEVGAGCGRFAIAWLINLSAMALGAFCAPRAVFAAYVRGRQSYSIYRALPTAETLARTTVGAIRQRLRVNTVATVPQLTDYIGFVLWSAAGLALLVAPAILVVFTLWSSLRALAQ
jgi:hypothetical protein